LTAAGSGVNLGITRLLAEAFLKKNRQTMIEIPGSIGSRGAVKAAAEGAIDLGLLSRPLSRSETELGLKAVPYARVPIVVAAHSSVKDEGITFEELIRIFQGTKTRWKNGNEIVVQAREKTDSGFQVLQERIPGFKEVYAESHQTKRWTLYFTDQDANRALSSTANAIGVTDLGMISTEHLDVHVLELNGVAPSPENLLSGAYPLWRDLSFVFLENRLSKEAGEFMDFVRSDEGQRILKIHGYLPVKQG